MASVILTPIEEKKQSVPKQVILTPINNAKTSTEAVPRRLPSEVFLRARKSYKDNSERVKPPVSGITNMPGYKTSPAPTFMEKATDTLKGLMSGNVVRPGEKDYRAIADSQIRLDAKNQGLGKEDYIDKVNPGDKGVREFLRFNKGIGSGILGTAEGLSGGLEWLSNGKLGKDLANQAMLWQKELAPDNPKFTDALASGTGSMATFFLPGLGIQSGAAKVASVAPKLAGWLGVGTSTALEAMTEAGQVYRNAFNETKDKGKAESSALKTFWTNIPLIAVTNKLGVFGEKGTAAKRALMSALTEGGQEVITAKAQGKPVDFKNVLTSGAVGMITGGGIGGGVGLMDNNTDSSIPVSNNLSVSDALQADGGGGSNIDPQPTLAEPANPQAKTGLSPRELLREGSVPTSSSPEQLDPLTHTAPIEKAQVNDDWRTSQSNSLNPDINIGNNGENVNTQNIPPSEPPISTEGAENNNPPNNLPTYESLKDAWFGKKDLQALRAYVEAANYQDLIKDTVGESKYKNRSKDIDKAIQIYIDLKRNPEHLAKFFSKLSLEQKRIVNLSQNLTAEQKNIADKITRSYQEIGAKSKDADVIRNTIDNYAARVWDVTSPKINSEQFRKFGTKTRHAKARTFDTIVEGWANGYNLKVEGATNNLAILSEEMSNVIQDKTFLKQLQTLTDVDGNSILSTRELEGYKRVEHPNFKVWKFAGQAEPADLQGKNFIQTPDGTILERRELYAPEDIAQNLNNIMGVSKLKGIKAIDAVTKYNAVVKSWVLQTSFFHHLAFMRSYYLGSAPFKDALGEASKKFKSGENFIGELKKLTPRQAYKDGYQAIKNLTPEIELLTKNGLTLGKIQDWEESILRNEDTFIGRWMDKYGATKAIKDKINTLRQNQADFLFKQFGAGLKAKAALIEFKNIIKKHPDMNINEAAKITANLINDDFGGLHLKRLGRNPTNQHIFRIFALAPDWTESNIRSAVKTFKRGEEAEIYRRFWARIITKSMFATLAANALLHGKDLPEMYMKAWKSGNLRWLDVDITPIYKLFGGDTEARKYFSAIGHFKDPLKFAIHPIKSAHYKGSIVYSSIYELITGEDWAGRQFTEFPELLKTGSTVRPSFTFTGKPNKYSQMPSYLISQLKGSQPVQAQNLLNWWMGETEAFDAIGQSLGLGIRTTFVQTPEQKRKEKIIRRQIKILNRKKR